MIDKKNINRFVDNCLQVYGKNRNLIATINESHCSQGFELVLYNCDTKYILRENIDIICLINRTAFDIIQTAFHKVVNHVPTPLEQILE